MLPEFIAKGDTGRSQPYSLFVGGNAAQKRSDTEQREQARADMLHANAFRGARTGHGYHIGLRHEFNLLEDLVIGSPVSHVRARDRSAISRKSWVAIR